ncbi:hypothetical protein [Helicobacter zhangjianzhongii]|uniref:hypothetical protein n=1 Tax=Helicobacter zhangjianzhongii TaxID=2974574 RepID=UPI0025523568|nr:hypothetical protein [Helicobacter sp. CPD2-1]MDL0079203.1 hypothetical protein [Helicobacter sp. CPD2-1]
MRLITRFFGQPQTSSLALPKKSRKATTAPPQFLESLKKSSPNPRIHFSYNAIF